MRVIERQSQGEINEAPNCGEVLDDKLTLDLKW